MKKEIDYKKISRALQEYLHSCLCKEGTDSKTCAHYGCDLLNYPIDFV